MSRLDGAKRRAERWRSHFFKPLELNPNRGVAERDFLPPMQPNIGSTAADGGVPRPENRHQKKVSVRFRMPGKYFWANVYWGLTRFRDKFPRKNRDKRKVLCLVDGAVGFVYTVYSNCKRSITWLLNLMGQRRRGLRAWGHAGRGSCLLRVEWPRPRRRRRPSR